MPSVEFADHHEIDAALGRPDDRGRDAGNKPARPYAGIEVEDEAQFDLRHDLGVVGIAHRRQAAGAEQDGVGLLAQLDRRLRHRLAVVAVVAGAGRTFGEAEVQPGSRSRGLAQHLQRRRHHLGADAVAWHHGDMERVIGEHWCSPAPKCALLNTLRDGRATAVSDSLKVRLAPIPRYVCSFCFEGTAG